MTVTAFTTPPRNQPNRKDVLQQLSLRLTSNSVLNRLSPLYNPTEEDTDMDPATRRLLVHGTRLSSLADFLAYGVLPPPFPNTLAPGPAFYTTSNPQLAYLHPLFVQPRALSSIADPVVLLVFKVSPLVLHGNSPDSNSRVHSCMWFPADSEDEMAELIEHGEDSIGSKVFRRPLKDQVDFVIAPHLVPKKTPLGEPCEVYVPSHSFLPKDTPRPTQVAAATTAAWFYFSNSIDEIIIEQRVAEAVEETIE
ncbi:hypothetical protein B0H13DRAFT_172792 [Mycena leptocephala]|nr:hypothetical protein B0H13DRAFT_172792 [Mycena leptocephala]